MSFTKNIPQDTEKFKQFTSKPHLYYAIKIRTLIPQNLESLRENYSNR